jgi:hypothetical protein
MPRPNRQWPDDRLGDLTRQGLSSYRHAQPSEVVWSQIAAEIATSRQRRPPGVSLSRATMLSVVLVAGLALTSLGAQVHRTAATRSRLAAATVMDGLGPVDYEVALRAATPGTFDMRLPPESARPFTRGTPREAYNRAAWLVDLPRPAGGNAEALSPVVGQ